MADKHAKRGKEKRARRFRLAPKRAISALVPEHLGDVFSLLLVMALAGGAAIFFLFAWLPTEEEAAAEAQRAIPFFSEDELQEIVKVLDAREEASTAPVESLARDPFK